MLGIVTYLHVASVRVLRCFFGDDCCKERTEHRNPKQSLHCRGIEDEARQRNKGSFLQRKATRGLVGLPKSSRRFHGLRELNFATG